MRHLRSYLSTTFLHVNIFHPIVAHDVFAVYMVEASWAKINSKRASLSCSEDVLAGPPTKTTLTTTKSMGHARKHTHLFANLFPEIFAKCWIWTLQQEIKPVKWAQSSLLRFAPLLTFPDTVRDRIIQKYEFML